MADLFLLSLQLINHFRNAILPGQTILSVRCYSLMTCQGKEPEMVAWLIRKNNSLSLESDFL